MCCPGGWSGRDSFQEGLREVAATAVTHSTRKEREESMDGTHSESEGNERGLFLFCCFPPTPALSGRWPC